MENDDAFFDGDDDFVWPELSSSGELPDNNVFEITMCSVPSTPESLPNHQHTNLGFSKVEEDVNTEIGDQIRVNLEAKSSLEIEDDCGEIEFMKEDEASKLPFKLGLVVEDDNCEMEIDRKGEDKEGFRVNLAANLLQLEKKSSFKVEDDNDDGKVKSNLMIEEGDDEMEIVTENKGLGVNLAGKSSKVEAKSSLKVEDDDGDDDDEVQVVRKDEFERGIRVNLAEKSSKVEAKSRLKVVVVVDDDDDDDEVEVVRKDEFEREIMVNLAAKEWKLKSCSSLKAEVEVMKKQKIEEGIRVTKASKSRSEKAGKSSLSSMDCLIEMLKQMYVIEKKWYQKVDVLETVKLRGMTFPTNRFLNKS